MNAKSFTDTLKEVQGRSTSQADAASDNLAPDLADLDGAYQAHARASRKTKRVLTDDHWKRLVPLLPKHLISPKRGRPRADNRECLEGLLWLLRTGARWQDIPVDLPSGSTCWRRLQQWVSEGILHDIQAILLEELVELGEVDFDELLADTTFIRAKKGGSTTAKPRLVRV